MAGTVVDPLEVIQVDEAEHTVAAVLQDLAAAFGEGVFEGRAVQQAGERIVGGGIAQMFLHGPRLTDVGKHQHAAEQGAIATAHGCCLATQGDGAAGRMAQRRQALQAGGTALGQAVAHRVGHQAAVLAFQQQDLFDGQAACVLAPPAAEALGHRVEEADPAFQVGGDHTVADGVEGHLQALTLVVQALGQLAQFADVPVGAHHAQRFAGGIADQPRVALDHALGAIGAADAELDIEPALAIPRGHHLALGPFGILGMQVGVPLGVGQFARSNGAAVEAVHALVPEQPVAGQVPLPDPDAAGFGGHRIAPRQLRLAFLGTLAAVDVLDLRDEVVRLTVVVADQGHRQQAPDRPSALVQVALLQAVAVAPPGEDLVHQRLVAGQVVGVGDVLEAQGGQLVFAVAEHLAKGTVDPLPAPIQPHQGHADGGVVHGVAKARLAGGQLMAALAQLLHGGGQQQRRQ
ncbi:hypothetical protein D9M68_515740 [compost metagenome]